MRCSELPFVRSLPIKTSRCGDGRPDSGSRCEAQDLCVRRLLEEPSLRSRDHSALGVFRAQVVAALETLEKQKLQRCGIHSRNELSPLLRPHNNLGCKHVCWEPPAYRSSLARSLGTGNKDTPRSLRMSRSPKRRLPAPSRRPPAPWRRSRRNSFPPTFPRALDRKHEPPLLAAT